MKIAQVDLKREERKLKTAEAQTKRAVAQTKHAVAQTKRAVAQYKQTKAQYKATVEQRRMAELGVRRSAMSTPSHHYNTIAAMPAAFRESTEPTDFCIRLLPQPPLESESAYNLFQAVGGLDVGVLEDRAGGVQDTWNQALGENVSNWPETAGGKPVTMTAMDTHRMPYRNNRKPDISHFEVGNRAGHSDVGVVVIGNLKRRMRHVFTTKAKGELMGQVGAFLAVQPKTTGMTAYLMDGQWIQFFRVNRDCDPASIQGFKYIEGPLHDLGSEIGRRWFWGLMTTPVSDLGWELPRLRFGDIPLTVERFLGSGSTGMVYHCTYPGPAAAAGDDDAATSDDDDASDTSDTSDDDDDDDGGDDAAGPRARAGAGAAGAGAAGAGAGARNRYRRRLDVVVKVCPTEEEAHAERDVLMLLNKAGVAGVQRLAGMTACGKGIVTTPLTEPLANRRGLGDVLQGVVTTLEAIHALNLVHRDVSKANILVTPEGESLLVDVGGAVPPNVPVPYHGTLEYAAPHIMERFPKAAAAGTVPGDIAPRESDDLQSLLRVAYVLVFPFLSHDAPLRSEQSEYLAHRMEALTLSGVWDAADSQAKRLDYTALRAFFEGLCPVGRKKRKASAM